MSTESSAEIIVFPVRIMPEADLPAAPSQIGAADRLSRALADLTAAQAEQRAALERWQAALANLQSGVQDLGGSLRGYVKALSEIAPSTTAR